MITTRDRSNAQEQRVASTFNGKVNPNSGAVDSVQYKGDVRHESYLFECKCTTHQSISLKLEDIRKIQRQAQDTGKQWIVDLEFQDENSTKADYSLSVVDRNLFQELVSVSNSFQQSEDSKDAEILIDFFQSFLSTLSSKDKNTILQLLGRYTNKISCPQKFRKITWSL